MTGISETGCKVAASEGDRVYTVRVDLNTGEVFSDDNGTVYRNYVGYPVIAFLMVRGILPYNERIANPLKGIRWRTLNERLRSYKLVEREVANLLKGHDISWSEVERFAEDVLSKLGGLQLWKRP